MRKLALLLCSTLLFGCATYSDQFSAQNGQFLPQYDREYVKLQLSKNIDEVHCGDTLDIRWEQSPRAQTQLKLYEVNKGSNFWLSDSLRPKTNYRLILSPEGRNIPSGSYRIILEDPEHNLYDRSQIIEFEGCSK